MVRSTPRPHFTPAKDKVPILQEAGWAPGPVWTGGKSRPHRDSIPDLPARSQSLYRLSYPSLPCQQLQCSYFTRQVRSLLSQTTRVNCRQRSSLALRTCLDSGSMTFTFSINTSYLLVLTFSFSSKQFRLLCTLVSNIFILHSFRSLATQCQFP